MRKISFIYLITILAVLNANGQVMTQVPFDSSIWNTENAELIHTTFQGRKAVLLNKGGIYLKDIEFLNGVIEVDINISNRRNFPGVIFRMTGRGNYEHFYVRPHQSGNPDANQYTPVFNGTAGWQLYYGEQWSFPVAYNFGEWHHLKIVVRGGQADIYLDNMEQSALQVDLLRDVAPGTIGVNTGIAPVYFANFKYSKSETTYPATSVESTAPENAITQWMISDVIADSLTSGTTLDRSLKDLTWKLRDSESNGVINLSRFGVRKQGHNTVAVRLSIETKQQQVRKLEFGFSDKVKLFLNDKAIYEGHDRYMSRDYRYLGTIGFFDTVYLPLKKGQNELWFLITEAFGGWGLQAKFDDIAGLEIK